MSAANPWEQTGVLFREDLDQAPPGKTRLQPWCHDGGPVPAWPFYDRDTGRLVLQCVVCQRAYAVIQVSNQITIGLSGATEGQP